MLPDLPHHGEHRFTLALHLGDYDRPFWFVTGQFPVFQGVPVVLAFPEGTLPPGTGYTGSDDRKALKRITNLKPIK